VRGRSLPKAGTSSGIDDEPGEVFSCERRSVSGDEESSFRGRPFVVEVSRLLEPIDRSDVRVIERRQDLSLALEALHALVVSGERFGQNFDRHLALQLRIGGAINLAHPASSNEGFDLVPADGRPCVGRF